MPKYEFTFTLNILEITEDFKQSYHTSRIICEKVYKEDRYFLTGSVTRL